MWSRDEVRSSARWSRRADWSAIVRRDIKRVLRTSARENAILGTDELEREFHGQEDRGKDGQFRETTHGIARSWEREANVNKRHAASREKFVREFTK